MNEVIGFAAVIVSIFAGILFQNGRLDRVESRLTERMDKNQAEMSGRIDQLSARMDRMQSELNGRMDRMQSELNIRIDRIQADLIVFFRDLGRHDARIEAMEKKAS
jgi:uncharacterized protein (DUF885 family)